MKELIIATGNKGKLREIREILKDLPLSILSMDVFFKPLPDIAETGSTFAENAHIKAAWVFEKTGIATMADDSGLLVDFLNGAPGVYSARFAGEGAGDHANCQKLLSALADCPMEKRTARFACAIEIMVSGTVSIHAFGTCEGHILEQAQGSGGFGYDPLFVPDGYHQSFAELDHAIKNSISHRAHALTVAKAKLTEILNV